MGVISILLGIIAFIAFTGAGAILGNEFVNWSTKIGESFTTMKVDLSNNTIMILFIGIFGFIGLLIGMSLIMHGINYNKLVKIQKRIRRL